MAERKPKKGGCKWGGCHEPFVNPMLGSMPAKHIDGEGLLGVKGKTYYECYICNAFYDPKTGKTAHWKKSKKIARGQSEGMWRIG